MKELLFSVTKIDFVIEWYSGSGAGGQHRNKHQNCCRIKHAASGAEATGTESRSREQNQKTAFRRLVNSNKFQVWLKRVVFTKDELRQQQAEIERRVDEMMDEKNIKVEYL